MPVEWFFSWFNLIYILPFGIALIYLGLYTISGITFGDGDADVHLEADGDVDAGVHLDVDADGDLDADADADADVDHPSIDHDAGEVGGHGVMFNALSWMGLGRVPLSIILMVLLLSWGMIGFCTNFLMWPKVPQAGRVVMLSLPLALIGSTLIARLVVQLVARFLPTNETYVHRRHELLGLCGEAIFNVDRDSGLVSVRDERGDLFQVACRVYRDGPAIAKGSKVKLVAYNGKEGMFYVTATEPSRQTA